MIRGFRDKSTEAVWRGEAPKGFPPDLLRRAQVKLAMLAAATDLIDLRTPRRTGWRR